MLKMRMESRLQMTVTVLRGKERRQEEKGREKEEGEGGVALYPLAFFFARRRKAIDFRSPRRIDRFRFGTSVYRSKLDGD